jgi:hypothetical protein
MRWTRAAAGGCWRLSPMDVRLIPLTTDLRSGRVLIDAGVDRPRDCPASDEIRTDQKRSGRIAPAPLDLAVRCQKPHFRRPQVHRGKPGERDRNLLTRCRNDGAPLRTFDRPAISRRHYVESRRCSNTSCRRHGNPLPVRSALGNGEL